MERVAAGPPEAWVFRGGPDLAVEVVSARRYERDKGAEKEKCGSERHEILLRFADRKKRTITVHRTARGDPIDGGRPRSRGRPCPASLMQSFASGSDFPAVPRVIGRPMPRPKLILTVEDLPHDVEPRGKRRVRPENHERPNLTRR